MARDSLIAQAERQPDLLSSDEMDSVFFDLTEKAGEFTGERLFAREPRLYHACKSLLAEGVGMIRIGRLLGLSAHTVSAVRDREKVPIAIEKEDLSRLALTAARLAFESVGEDLANPAVRAEISPRDKALIGAISVDKAMLLKGEATMRLDVEMRVPDHDGFNSYIAGLRTGRGGETGAAKEDGTAAIEAASAPATEKESGVP